MVLRELPMPRGRQHRAKMVRVSDSMHVKVPGSSEFTPPPPTYPDPPPIRHLDALRDTVTKDGGNQLTGNVVGVDGETYVLAGGVWHGLNLSPSGEPVYTVTGSGFLSASLGTLSQPYTLMAVVKASVTNARMVPYGGSTSFVELGLDGTSAWYGYSAGSGGTPPFSLTNTNSYDTNMHVLECIYNAGSSLLGVDGVEVAGTVSNRFMSGVRMGSDRLNSYPFQGDVAEAVVFAGALSAADRSAWRDYLTAKWLTP